MSVRLSFDFYICRKLNFKKISFFVLENGVKRGRKEEGREKLSEKTLFWYTTLDSCNIELNVLISPWPIFIFSVRPWSISLAVAYPGTFFFGGGVS